MAVCQSCGGIIGRDCFNPMECAIITARENSQREGQINNTENSVNELWRQFDALKEHLIALGIINAQDMDYIMIPSPQPSLEYHRVNKNEEDLPF